LEETMPDSSRCDGSHFSVDCPSRLLFDQVADKWSMMIMTVLSGGGTRFNELKRRLEGVSQKSLSMTLKRLERNGIIARTVVASTPPGVLYEMTPLGLTLLPPFQAIYLWANDNMDAVEAARMSYDRMRGVD
jgi:DNA-binding HxlR family transcriptional regulator